MNKIKYLFLVLIVSLFTNVYAEEITSSQSYSYGSSSRTSENTTSTTDYGYNYRDILDNIENEDSVETKKKYDETNAIGYKTFIYDYANLFSDKEKDDLFKYMTQISDYGNIGVITLQHNDYYSTREYAEKYYYNNFGHSNGSLFIIDMDYREIYLVNEGKSKNIITSSKSRSITDNVYRYATNRDYYGCAYHTMEQIYKLLNGYKIAEPMRITVNVFLSLTIGTLIIYIVAFFIHSNRKASQTEIVNSINNSVNINNVDIQKSGTRRVYSPQSSSSGGGSSGGGGFSGGGGGGGGFSGSGGGHSF